MDLKIELDGVAALKVIDRLSSELKNATKLMTLIGESQLRAIDGRFDDEIDPDGSPWAALNPQYLESKRRRRLSLKRNQATGEMKKRIKYRAFPDRLEVTSEDKKSSLAQAKRPFLYSKKGELGRKSESQITQLTDNYFQALIDK